MSKIQDNDTKIKKLKSQIENKLENLPKISKDFNTNLILTFQDKQYNLNVVSTEVLKELLIKLYLYQNAVETLHLDFSINNYMIEDWMADINKIIELRNVSNKRQELKRTYEKLNVLLSDTAKTEDFLESVENSLKD